MQGQCQSLCVVDLFKTRCASLRKHCVGSLQLPPSSGHSAAPLLSLDPALFGHAARLLRDDVAADDPDALPSRNDIIHWCWSMSQYNGSAFDLVNHVNRDIGTSKSMFDMERLILCLKICINLKGDAHLRTVLCDSGTLIGLPMHWLSDNTHIKTPSKTTLRKTRFHLDAGLAILTRRWFASMMARALGGSDDITCFFLVDSSPRVGREWCLMELYIIFDSQLNAFFECMDRIKLMYANDNVDSILEKELMDQMRACIHHILFTPVAMGVGNAGLAVKPVCRLHAFVISFGPTWEHVSF